MFIAYRYTLGGFYLARYSDSPVGAFEEVGLLYFDAEVLAQSAARAQVFQGPCAHAKPLGSAVHMPSRMEVLCTCAAGGVGRHCVEPATIMRMGGQSICQQQVRMLS